MSDTKNDPIKVDRREFIKGAAAAAAAGVAGPSLFFSEDAAAAPNAYDTVLVVFLRGGMDGLNLVVPTSGADRGFYETNRPTLSIPNTGTNAALPLTLAGDVATPFGLHPSASGLHGIWNAGKLAIVHCCGMPTVVNRSHFDAQSFLDAGTPGDKTASKGWLTRAWETQLSIDGTGAQMPLLAVTPRSPKNIRGSTDAISMPDPTAMALNLGDPRWRAAVSQTVGQLWGGDTALEVGGSKTDSSLKLIAGMGYGNAPTGWPAGVFADQLWTVAQSIRFNRGLRYATVDLGGWDTHDAQGTVGVTQTYPSKIAELSDALTAFFNNLAADGLMDRVTVIVQSEFGRRVKQNQSGGTDHGYGNPLLVLGGPVVGRKFYGQWKGLSSTALAATFGDIPVTTDYRRVFSEILMRRMRNNQLSTIFPGYTYGGNMGIVTGTSMTPATTALVGASLSSDRQPEYGSSLEPVVEELASRRLTRRGWIDRFMAALGLNG